MKKKILYVIGGFLLILIVTNPSYKDFKEHLSLAGDDYPKRTNNFFVCSTYRWRQAKYFGVLGNFFKLTPNKQIQPISTRDSTVKVDSTVMTDTTRIPPLPKGYTPVKN